ncbi:hypothetical protein, partial [Micromonospora sp. NPDC049102]|uniref:hypothetical protein n=1 Tax=Micromonospora sp. NPDC049102 TaxID=3364265 RepID=UPI0037175E0B
VRSYDDGSKVSYDGSDHLTSQVSGDGTVFSAFDAEGRPSHAVLPHGRGSVAISHAADGGSTWSYDDGSKVSYDGSNHLTSQVSGDGTVFSAFDAEGRPSHAVLPHGRGTVAISHAADGGSTWSYSDGTRVERDLSGRIIRETTSDGIVFDQFDGNGRPVHGRVPGTDGNPPQTVSIQNRADGTSTWTYHDAGGATTMTLTRSASGQPLTMVQDGWTFSNFDNTGRPQAGHGANGDVTIEYRANGLSIWRYTDTGGGQTVIVRDADNNPKTMVADGWIFSSFDSQGRPLAGSSPAENGGPPQKVTISYGHDGSSTWRYGDGTVVNRTGDGHVTSMVVDGWTYTKFDNQGRPTYGTKDGKSISISYTGDWTVTKYSDGTTIGVDSQGHPIYQINPDGTRFEYRVEIPKLLVAKNIVAAQAALLDGHLARLQHQSENIVHEWQSPAGRQYEMLTQKIDNISDAVQAILHESVIALERSYNQYVAAEGGNLNNLTPVDFHANGSVSPR